MANVKQIIKEDLEKLEGLYTKREELKTAQNKQTDKHLKIFNEATKPINEKFDKKLLPINSEISELEKSIKTAFDSTKDKDGSFKLGKVEHGSLIVEPVSSQSAREVDAKVFFDSVPANKRESVWSSLKVLIAKAEKLVGKEALDKIASVKTTWSVTIRRKPKD